LREKTVHVRDIQEDPEYGLDGLISLGDFRTTIGVPLLREGSPIGVFFLTRTRVDPFTQQQIDLVATFADQAVIAIENVRLFDEVKARTEELSESLQQQTATADVLKVISRSTFDLQTVLDTLVESAARLCEAEIGCIIRPQGSHLQFAANYRMPREFVDLATTTGIAGGRGRSQGGSYWRPIRFISLMFLPIGSTHSARRIELQASDRDWASRSCAKARPSG